MRHKGDYAILVAILLVTLLQGIAYLLLVPPWQHYDEPNHFEYVWLIANRSQIPKPGDYDQVMRREVARSMIEHNFFEGMNFTPDLNSEDTPIWIGAYSQLGDPPLYYLVAALPLRLFWRDAPYRDITWQLYAVRLVSLSLYLISIAIGWGLVRELTLPGDPLRWGVPLFMALLPAYSDVMTSVNSDVAAVVVFSFFLWGSVRLIKRGFSIFDLSWVVLSAILCYWTKSSVWLAIPFLVPVFIFAWIRHTQIDQRDGVRLSGLYRLLNKSTELFLGIVAIFLGIAIISTFTWGDAALWYRETLQITDTRVLNPESPVGDHAFQLDFDATEPFQGHQFLFQLIPEAVGEQIRGQTVTLGAWIWATRGIQIQLPLLNYYGNLLQKDATITIDRTPAFYTTRMNIPGKTGRFFIILSPEISNLNTDVTVFYDGLVLMVGDTESDTPPVFTDTQGNTGMWAGSSFHNLLRNASAERAGIRLRPWVDEYGEEVIPDKGRPSLVLYSFTDWNGAGWYYVEAVKNLLRTFWAKFGWGHVPLVGSKPYRILGLVSLVGVAGLPITIYRRHKEIPWLEWILLGLALIGVWGFALIRGAIYLNWRLFLPAARYAYPAIIPTMWLWNIGMQGWVSYKGEKLILWATLTGLFLLDILSIFSILTFYRR
jgi:hypothetical protein